MVLHIFPTSYHLHQHHIVSYRHAFLSLSSSLYPSILLSLFLSLPPISPCVFHNSWYYSLHVFENTGAIIIHTGLASSD